jgi:hypothetical protein
MHEVLSGLLVAAVVVVVLMRRFTPRRVDERGPFILPVVIGAIGLVQGRTIDPRHAALSAGLLAAEVAVALLLGIGLGVTMRVWRAPDGSHWSRGTWATFGVFLASVAVRGGLVAIGYAAGVRPGSGAILVSVAAWLLAQNAVIRQRARALTSGVNVYP